MFKNPLLLSLLCVCTLPAAAQDATNQERATAASLDTVTVSATRLRSVPGFDVPASVDTILLGSDSNRPETNASEALAGIPGVSALDRQNYAQDTQLSIRGFGARSTFGVRGVRLFADGIPASMPDGQGQLSHFNLTGGDRLEVMRGPFSALYGNSSGGVVQLWSKDGESGDPWRVKATYGSNEASTLAAQLLGKVGSMGYNVAASRFDTDGFRDHSEARRDSANVKLGFDLGDSRRLDLIVNYLDLPEAQDPLGLTRAAFDANPSQAAAVATQFNTRKSVSQKQAGLVYEQSIGNANTLRVMGYGGTREIEQFLAIPAATQTNPLNSGGNVALDNGYGGADLRWSWQGELASRPLELTAGTNYDRQRQQRNGYENFVGTTLGVRGRLRRDEVNTADNLDQFAQAWFKFAERWSVLAGVRHSKVEFSSTDRYITATNPNDSGSVKYSNTTPVGGLMFSAAENLRFYASAGKGFETPTFNEIGYRADGNAGLALNLKAAESSNFELGGKWHNDAGFVADAALFRAATDDELAVARNVGGRSSYQNVAAARRQGFETSVEAPLPGHLRARIAYTYVDATFRSAYLTCVVAGCTTPNTPVAAGSRIPGVPHQQLFSRLQWSHANWTAAVEGVGASNMVVNDIASQAAPGYFLMHLEASRAFAFDAGQLRGYARIDNVTDRAYVGSIIVNEGNGRFYEPGPDRTFQVGAQWQW